MSRKRELRAPDLRSDFYGIWVLKFTMGYVPDSNGTYIEVLPGANRYDPDSLRVILHNGTKSKHEAHLHFCGDMFTMDMGKDEDPLIFTLRVNRFIRRSHWMKTETTRHGLIGKFLESWWQFVANTEAEYLENAAEDSEEGDQFTVPLSPQPIV